MDINIYMAIIIACSSIYALYLIEYFLYGVVWYCLDIKKSFGLKNIGFKLSLVKRVENGNKYSSTKHIYVPFWKAQKDFRDLRSSDCDDAGLIMIALMPIVYCVIGVTIAALLAHVPTVTIVIASIFGVMTLIRMVTLKLKKVYQELKEHKEDPKAHKKGSK